jgi:hypothetical protein
MCFLLAWAVLPGGGGGEHAAHVLLGEELGGGQHPGHDLGELVHGLLDPEVIKTRPRLMAALATAHVRQGNIDEACRLGSEALDLAARQQVARNLQDVRRLRVDLEPWRRTRAVRELDDQLALAG